MPFMRNRGASIVQRIDLKLAAIPLACLAILLAGCGGGGGDSAPASAAPSASAAGPAGANGKTILSGANAPAADVGTDGDFYLNASTSTLYGPKADGAWPAGVSLVGPQGVAGAPGAVLLHGAADPTAADGSKGSFYLNTATNTLFGPKTAEGWPAGVSVVGLTGPVGAQGPQGEKGEKGDTGPQGQQGETGAGATIYTANFAVYDSPDGNGTYVMTGTALDRQSNDPNFGAVMPVGCSGGLTLNASLAGPVPDDEVKYTLAAYRVASGAALETIAPLAITDASACSLGATVRTCSAPATTAVAANDIVQVQVSGNRNFKWGGGLYVNLSCKSSS
ncbi:collagen-like protein [Cupriavidus necator H16]|uniref:Collagen-like protein n=1 Tax=Cupriavidus necator (strain ATCC 17699 / DSM 428 / KCTC 22496 / NCIMB 10442 / H16 / Stanier 337) TaxID=381666 RepID=A0AAE5ZAR9_CUPNH|nr:collagen-like protein [Cupriavidus necator H16]QQB77678.1 collagen-like protein [Cupriavidus necator]